MKHIRMVGYLCAALTTLCATASGQESSDTRPYCFSSRDYLFIEAQPDFRTLALREIEAALSFCGEGYDVTDLVSHKERVFIEDPRDIWPTNYIPVYQSTYYVTCCSTPGASRSNSRSR